MLEFEARGIAVAVDPRVGHIADLRIESGGRTIRPLHQAPWLDEPQDGIPADTADGLRYLSGDFLCAPFSRADVETAPSHGWPANSAWSVLSSEAIAGGWQARLRLDRTVMGATIEKRLTLRDGHPFLYQEHVISGGVGELPVAHHAMTVMAAGGKLAFSPKRFAMTPAESLEPDPSRGRYRLAYPGRSERLDRFPLAAGGFTDLADYPVGERNEDFVILAEAAHDGPAWTAVARQAEGDLVLVLKNPRVLPVTMLWISNGGRDYAPWNGRHVGVLGIEDGRTAIGHAQSIGDNALNREGIATTFELGGDKPVVIRQAIGALPLQRPGETPLSVMPDGNRLRLEFAGAASQEIVFDADFLA